MKLVGFKFPGQFGMVVCFNRYRHGAKMYYKPHDHAEGFYKVYVKKGDYYGNERREAVCSVCGQRVCADDCHG